MHCIVCKKIVKKRHLNQKYCGRYYEKGSCAWTVGKIQSRLVCVRERCFNKNHKNYSRYCNIGMCDEWKNGTREFVLWALKNGWKQNLQIDRIENDKGYFPENCRFVTRSENCRNKKNNVTDWIKNTRVCRVCKNEKSFSDMAVSRKEVGGIAYECKLCRKEIYKKRRSKKNNK